MLSEHPVLGKRAIVATAHYLAPHAGLHILTQGWKCYRCSYGSCFCYDSVTCGSALSGAGINRGDGQPQIHVQLLSAMIDFQRNAQQAVSASRWHSGRFQDKLGRRG